MTAPRTNRSAYRYRRPRRRFVSDIRPEIPPDVSSELATLLISYARVIVRMPAAEAEVAVRAMEATVSEWSTRAANGVQKTHEPPA